MTLSTRDRQHLQLLEHLKDNLDGKTVLDTYLDTGLSEYGTRVRLRELEVLECVTRRKEEGVPVRQAAYIWSITTKGDALIKILTDQKGQG